MKALVSIALHEFENGYNSPGPSLSFLPKQRRGGDVFLVSFKDSSFNIK
jgi:hypothetical protein